MRRYQDHDGVLLLAHRGGAGEAPENSMEAFRRAVNLGFTYLETDVRVAEDGILYIVHNPTSYLPNSALKLRGNKRLLTLEELFNAFPHAFFAVDPKHDCAVQPLAELIVKYKMENRVCVGSSFDYRTGRTATLVQELSGTRPCTALVGISSLYKLLFSPEGLEAKRHELKASYIHVPARLVSNKTVSAAHGAGLKVIAWVLNDKRSIETALSHGVDGFMTDYPSVALQLLR